MPLLLTGSIDAITPSEKEIDIARESSDLLAHFPASDQNPLRLHLTDQATGQEVEAAVPAAAVRVLSEALAQMAQGRPITLIPLHAELSTQQAADLLGISRPYFIKLLEQKAMPFRKVGEQRRVKYQDLLAYLQRYQQEAGAALDTMAEEAQQLGLYE